MPDSLGRRGTRGPRHREGRDFGEPEAPLGRSDRGHVDRGASEGTIGTQVAWVDARHPMVNRELWGLTLLERNIRELERLGYSEIHISTTEAIDPLGHLIHPRPERVTLTVAVADPGDPLAGLTALLREGRGPVLALEGHALNDRRLLTLATRADRDIAVLPSFGLNPGGLGRLSHTAGESPAPVAGPDLRTALEEAVRSGAVAGHDLSRFDPYMDNLRREVPPYVLRVENEEQLNEAEGILKSTVHKGVLELVAKYIHPPLEFGMVKLIDRTEITPNQITVVWLLLAALTVPLFMTGHILLGCVIAATCGILDGVDGKLARLTLRFSKVGDRLDHVGGTLYDAIWYLALAYYFSGGSLDSAGARYSILLLVSYPIHRIVPGLFRTLHGREIYDYRRTDELVRLVSARMNNNVWLVMLGALVGRAREAYYAMCVWMAVTAAWYVLRFLWVSAGKAFSGRRVPTA